MQDLQVTLVQATLRWREPAENRAHLQRLVLEAETAADLVVLPETFTTGFLGDAGSQAETMEGETVSWMRDLATATRAAVCGSLVVEDGGERYNRFVFVTPEGAVHHYDKRHLFAHGGEHTRFAAGAERVVFEWRGWRICPQVCYDLRFPAWCRNRDDYDLLLLVANWPDKRIYAWDVLLQARAIENQACVVGVNRVGADGNGKLYPGHSAAYGALGETLTRMGEEEGCATVRLDAGELAGVRDRLPFLADADAFELIG